jgi:hypothetical protein
LKQKMELLKHLVSNWWDKHRLQEHIQERQQTAAWAGLANLRLWIPWRFLNRTGDVVTIRPAADIEEALSYIHVSAPLPEAGMTIVDPTTQDKIAIYLDEEHVPDGQGNVKTFKRAELVFLDPARDTDEEADTVIRIVYANKEKPDLIARLQLGGRLTVADMNVQALITDPVIRTQRQLNLLTTLITRLGETAAFRERYIKNAKPQGTRYEYTEGDPVPDGAYLERDAEAKLWMVVPQERTLGARTTTELVGLPTMNEQGDEKGNQMPDVVIVDPVDPKPYIEAADRTRARILRMCAQGHLGGVSNAEASGIAYEQARAVFEKDLNKRRVSEEGMLRDSLTGAVAWAEEIAGEPGYFTDVLRITVDQRVDAGPRSPDLVRLDLESYEAGVLSQETTMARVGVEDVNAEMVRIRRSATYILEVIEKAVAGADAFTPESIIEVLKKLNLPQEIITVLEAKEEPEPTPPVGGPPRTPAAE